MEVIHATQTARKSYVDRLERVPLLGLLVSLGSYWQIQESIVAAAKRNESRSACFANVHMTMEADNRKEFANVVNRADWVATDGVPLTWALRLLYGIRQDRICGFDLVPDLISRATEEKLPIFFYGSTPEVLEKVVAKCQQLHPTVQIVGSVSPPFRALSVQEEEAIIEQINTSGARLVFVALGCPKQERWMCAMRGRIQAVLLGVGGALPLFAGIQSRAPRWMQRSGLEWTYRLAMEPGRLFKRYAITNSLFVLRLASKLLRRTHRHRFNLQPSRLGYY